MDAAFCIALILLLILVLTLNKGINDIADSIANHFMFHVIDLHDRRIKLETRLAKLEKKLASIGMGGEE